MKTICFEEGVMPGTVRGYIFDIIGLERGVVVDIAEGSCCATVGAKLLNNDRNGMVDCVWVRTDARVDETRGEFMHRGFKLNEADCLTVIELGEIYYIEGLKA